MRSLTNMTVLNSLNMPIIQSKEGFGDLLHLSPSLVHILTRNSTTYKYKIFQIPKKKSGFRVIYSPVYSLKVIQRWVLENILYKVKPSNNCYGYIKGIASPLVKNADKHKSNLFVMKLDIEDFFPSLKSNKVLRLFESIGYNREVSVLLTNICSCNGHLPQGAVTSPYLSNLLCIKLDLRLQRYCAKRDIVYTRYVDDLTFSSNNRDELKKTFHMFCKILEDEGFNINKDKTKFMTPKSKKTITGVTIADDKLKAPYEMKKLVRSMIHRAIVTGDYSQLNKIRGYISYISSIEENYKEKITNYIKKFYNDPVTLYGDAVKAYNANKIFSTLDDMEEHKISYFYDFDEIDELGYEDYYRRQDYLCRHGYIQKNDSIIIDPADTEEIPF